MEESLESLKSLKSLALESGQILLCFPQSGGFLESLDSLESLENGLFCDLIYSFFGASSQASQDD